MAGFTQAEVDQLLTLMHRMRQNLLATLQDSPDT
jgi:hypothetical protein